MTSSSCTDLPCATTYGTVIVPLDGSHIAAEALPHAMDEARRCGAPMVLVHVLPNNLDEQSRWKEMQAQRAQTEGYFDGLKRSLERYGVRVSWTIERGVVAEAIAEVARHADRPLIVLARRGMTAVVKAGTGLPSGTVADRLTALWHGPVSVVEPVI